jgi:hypothetical protein
VLFLSALAVLLLRENLAHWNGAMLCPFRARDLQLTRPLVRAQLRHAELAAAVIAGRELLTPPCAGSRAAAPADGAFHQCRKKLHTQAVFGSFRLGVFHALNYAAHV